MNPAIDIVRTPLHRLQLDMVARANDDAFFDYIEAVPIRDMQTASRIEQGLSGVKNKNGKSGASLQVLMPRLDVERPNPAGPITLGAVTCRCQEIPAINYGSKGTGISAEEIALKCLDLFHLWSPGFIATLRAGKDAASPNLDFDPRLTYDVTFTFDLGLRQTSKVLTPLITADDTEVVISCGTAGAEIYYTIDESLPTKLPPNGTLYTGSFALPEVGTVIRAVGYKTDSSASNVTETTIE